MQSAPTREEARKVVTNPQVRRQVATTAVLLGLLFLGGKHELDKVTTFRESLPPSSQVLMLEKSFLEQSKLFNTAEALKVSPEAVDFYLTESARPNSVLADLPLTDALNISSFAEQSGKGMFVLDYITRYGENQVAINALLDSSPHALSRYVDLVNYPDAILNRITPQQGLNIINGKVVQVDPALAVDLAAEIAKITGKDTWGSPFTGLIYFPEASPRAWAAEVQLAEIIKQSPNQINSSEAQALMRIISEESWRGNQNSLQLGPFLVKDGVTGEVIPIAGVERGVYIQEALNNSKGFFDQGDVYYALSDALKKAGIEEKQIDSLLWPINEGTIQYAMESKASLEFVYTDIDEILEFWKDEKNIAKIPIRVQELRWINDHAGGYGYMRDGNRWIWQSNP